MNNINMTECKICNKLISKNAKICPNCGELEPTIDIKIKNDLRNKKMILEIVPIIFFTIILILIITIILYIKYF